MWISKGIKEIIYSFIHCITNWIKIVETEGKRSWAFNTAECSGVHALSKDYLLSAPLRRVLLWCCSVPVWLQMSLMTKKKSSNSASQDPAAFTSNFLNAHINYWNLIEFMRIWLLRYNLFTNNTWTSDKNCIVIEIQQNYCWTWIGYLFLFQRTIYKT